MKFLKPLAAAVLILTARTAFPTQVAAQSQPVQDETQTALALTLQSAEEYAMQHNRDIMNASLEIRKAEAKKWQAIAAMLPQVSATFDYTSQLGFKLAFGGQNIAMPPYGTFGLSTGIGLSGASIVGVQIAKISKEMSDINLKKTSREIRDEVRQLYLNALVLQETISLLDENFKSLEDLHKMTEASVKVGVSEETAADQLLVQVNTMADNIASMKRNLEVIYNSMRLYLGVEDNRELILLQDLESLVSRDEAESLLKEKFNLDNNFGYQLLKQQTELTRKQIALTGWSNGPVLSMFHQYSAKKYFSDEATFNMTPPNMIGATLKVPIFTSLKTTMAIKEAKLSYKKQLNTMAQTENALSLQYRQQVFNLTSNLERFETQKKNIEVAQRVFDNIAKKYEYGVSSAMDVTQAMTSLVSAQSNYIQSMMEMVNAEIALAQLLNK